MMTSSMYPNLGEAIVYNPCLPACLALPNGHAELGTQITIFGKFSEEVNYHNDLNNFRLDLFLNDCEHFLGQPGDIAFHMNPRFDDETIVMNTFQYGRWGEEVVEEAMPLQAGKTFCMIVKIESDGFKVMIDGQLFATFSHRYNFNLIKRMHLDGRLKVDMVKFEVDLNPIDPCEEVECPSEGRSNRSRYPIYIIDPEIPHFVYNPEILSRPCRISISGTIEQPFTDFISINLADSNDEEFTEEDDFNDIPVHISIRSGDGKIVRNSLIDDEWGREETYLNEPFGLYPGTMFDMEIMLDEDRATVTINGLLAFEYRLRTDLDEIDSLEINGSVQISNIKVERIY